MPIDAPAHEGFDFMADIENERYCNPEVKDMQRIDAGPVGAGAEWEGDYRRMGTMRVRLDEYDRPRRLVFSTVAPRMDMHFVFEFAPVDRGAATDITANADVRPRGVLKLAAPLLGVRMR